MDTSPTDKPRIMIALDYADANLPSAIATLTQWANLAKEQNELEIVFGISASSRDSKDSIALMAKYIKPLYYWNEMTSMDANRILQSHEEINASPFYSGFNYGGLVNKLLLLANCANCKYLVRIDPGTYPFSEPSLEQTIRSHIFLIKDGTRVVSRGYEGRLGLRHTFVKDKGRQELLICSFTGIDPTQQVTGGALWTSSVPGVPAITFDEYITPVGKGLTLVWGSDDAFYQTLLATVGSVKINSVPIPRFDQEAMRKNTIEYYRGVVGMVYLSAIRDLGAEGSPEVRTEDFVDRLREYHLDPKKYRPMTPGAKMEDEFTMDTIAPPEFLESIRNGLENYVQLTENSNWNKIANLLKAGLFCGPIS